MSKTPVRARAKVRSELSEALDACRATFWAIGGFSAMSNILMLTGSIFMLEVYDRVIPSRSVSTLIALLLLAGGLYAALGLLDLIRGRVMVRISNWVDEAVSERVYDAVVRLPLIIGNRSEGVQPLRDLDSIRTFLSGLGPIAFFDLPWIPFYLAICFAFHPYIGLTALVGAVVLVALTLLTELMMRRPGKDVAEYARIRNLQAEASRRNCEAIVAMGMGERLAKRWRETNQQYVTANRVASDVGGGLGAISKVMRMGLQSLLLAVGALLVVNQQATAGVIIAGSILGARALAPVDLAIANWKSFVAARQAWGRLNKLLTALPASKAPMALGAPSRMLVVENASAAPPGEQKIVVQDVAFKLEAGNGLGIIGPTASGKSSLARLLVGVWRPIRGRVQLDGASLDQWSPEALGRHIGYLPQDVELLAGTVAQNISRFEEEADPNLIIAAAKAAGVHELIVGLPSGYETQVGEHGAALSAGQAQRVALARALYRDPFLVVLDEPNANLDSEGDEALTKAIWWSAGARRHRRGGCPSPERNHRRRSDPGDEQGAYASFRAEGGNPGQGAAATARRPAAASGSRSGRREKCMTKRRKVRRKLVNAAPKPRIRRWTEARRSVRRHVIFGIVLVLLLAGGVGGWAATSEIKGAVIAQGSIVVDSNVKKVQHPTGGVVGELFVRDGDRVKAGDVVVRLDDTVTRANLAIVTKGLNELLARKARLSAERDGASQITFPPELLAQASDPDAAAATASEIKLFNLRRAARDGQRDQLRQQIAQLGQETQGLAAQQASKTKEIDLVRRELDGVRDLYQKNLVQLTRLTSLEREVRSSGRRAWRACIFDGADQGQDRRDRAEGAPGRPRHVERCRQGAARSRCEDRRVCRAQDHGRGSAQAY